MNLYNLGSCYSLDFSDSNAQRGIYIIHEDDNIEFIPNKTSINFWRLYDEQIFNDHKYKSNDYFEIYISQQNLQDPRYSEKLSEYIRKYKNALIIPQYAQQIDESVELQEINSYNIENMIKDLIPDHLKSKFDKVLEISHKNSSELSK